MTTATDKPSLSKRLDRAIRETLDAEIDRKGDLSTFDGWFCAKLEGVVSCDPEKLAEQVGEPVDDSMLIEALAHFIERETRRQYEAGSAEAIYESRRDSEWHDGEIEFVFDVSAEG